MSECNPVHSPGEHALPYDRCNFAPLVQNGHEFYHVKHEFIRVVKLRSGRWLSIVPNGVGISETFEHAAFRALNAQKLLPKNTPEPEGAPALETH